MKTTEYTTIDSVMNAAHLLTPKRFSVLLNRARAAEHDCTFSEVNQCYSVAQNQETHWIELRRACERGEMVRAVVLDGITEDGRYYLRKFHPGSIPDGYLSPEVRRMNREVSGIVTGR